MSNSPTTIFFKRSRSCLGPWKRIAFKPGVHFLLSAIQLLRTERGQTTKNGRCNLPLPAFGSCSFRYWMSESVCRVFPRPISSPRIPDKPCYGQLRYLVNMENAYISMKINHEGEAGKLVWLHD